MNEWDGITTLFICNISNFKSDEWNEMKYMNIQTIIIIIIMEI